MIPAIQGAPNRIGSSQAQSGKESATTAEVCA
jgi:hypothetical protein